MTRRIKFKDGKGGAYACIDVGLASTSKVVEIRLDYLFGIGLVLFLLCFFSVLECLRPHFFLHDDNASFFLPDFLQTYDTLTKTGSLAEVNFYQYGGEPVIELGQSGVLYPPSYFCVGLTRLLGDSRWAVDLMIISHFIVGAVGLLVWQRLRGTDPVLAFFAACLWVISPFVLLVCSSGCAFAYTVAYLPWIFCALDQLAQRPGLRSSLFVALPMTLYFYSGVVQIYAYVVLFAVLYVFFHLTSSLKQNCAVLMWFAFAGIVILIFALPLLLPILHAILASVDRSQPMRPDLALENSLSLRTIFKTQFFIFNKQDISGLNSSLFFCPDLVLVPLALLGLRYRSSFIRACRFLALAVIALLLSTRAYIFLLLLPFFNRLRWPFKVFIFWKFFLLLFIFVGLTAWLEQVPALRKVRRLILAGLSAIVLVLTTGVVFFEQDSALFSHTQLPGLQTDLASVINPLQGRAMAVGKFVDDGRYLYRYLAYRYSTVFQLPNIGGYNPLIGRDAYSFGLSMQIPNVYPRAISPQDRIEMNRKCVRYLLINPNTLNGMAALRLDGIKVLLRDPDRIVLENLQADPMIVSDSGTSYGTFAYHGNSLFVPLSGKAETIGVSLNFSSNWWCRVDRGPWTQPVYRSDRIWSPVPASGRLLEVRYFDSSFRAGLMLSSFLILAVVSILIVFWRISKLLSLKL
ncbi:MAG: hypothetical protein LV481_11745 [Methylacidiphilales bacterium]|nr:hypothetical protein [Candidatus Methylacidiphilales bacterium]